jgi:hypothetical protein
MSDNGGGDPLQMSSIEVPCGKYKTEKTIQYTRTARSETTFAGDYCCMMGNWTSSLEPDKKKL